MYNNTKTEIDDVMLSKDQIDPDKRDDWQEVHNYIDAMNIDFAKLEIRTSMEIKTYNIVV